MEKRFPKFLEQVKSHAVKGQQLAADPQRVALLDLAQIADMHFGDHGRVRMVLEVVRPEAEQLI